MEVIQICKTKTRESWVEVNEIFWFEYAAGINLTYEEREAYRQKYGYLTNLLSPDTTLQLRRKVKQNGENLEFCAWDLIDVVRNLREAVYYMGDSDCWSGEGLHPLFEEMKTIRAEVDALIDEQEKLEDQITPAKFSRYSPLAEEFNARFEAALKEKRLFSKAQKGEVKPKVLAAIRNQIQEEYRAALNKITARLEEITTRLEELHV